MSTCRSPMVRSERSGKARVSSASSGEHHHLCRWADLRVVVAYREEPRGIPEARADVGCPALKLAAGPFEPVILVPEAACRQRRPFDVVFDVRSRQDHGTRLSGFEDHPLECAETRPIEVLDDFYDRGCLEARQAR